jgi:hypothetical protein
LEGIYASTPKRAFFGRYDFNHRELDPGSDAAINTFSAGFRQFFTDQLSLEGRVGVNVIDSFNGDQETTPSFFLTLRDQINEKDSAHVSFTKTSSTNPYSADVLDSWEISGGLNSQLFRRLSGSLSAFYGRGQYEIQDIDENLVGARAGLSYELTKDITGDLNYSFSLKDSDDPSREYTKNTVYVGIRAEY